MEPTSAIVPAARLLKLIHQSLVSRDQLALSLTDEDVRIRQWIGLPNGLEVVVDAVVSVLREQATHEWPSEHSWGPAAASAKSLLEQVRERDRLLELLARPSVSWAKLMNEGGGDELRRSLGEPDGAMLAVVVSYSLASICTLVKDHAKWSVPEGVASLLQMVAQLLDRQIRMEANFTAHLSAGEVDGATAEPLSVLVAAVAEKGSPSDVRTYLEAQIRRWDQPIWRSGLRASELERPLRVKSLNGGQMGARLTSEEALTGTPMLVVLGGPGAGKTWLAHRYAREAAKRALRALDSGQPLEAIEVPLLTTWDRWVRTTSDSLRDGLVRASLANGVDGLGGAEVTARLIRLLTHPNARVLVVLDSLDEAADLRGSSGQWNHIRDLWTLGQSQTWRVIVTSRFGAWDALARGVGETTRVAEIDPLSYPTDVASFVVSWFRDQPQRSAQLLREMEERPDLRRASTNPLLLTFICLLAEGDEPIPLRRRDLYLRITNKLLNGRWLDEQPSSTDGPYCHSLLTEWAWAAVGSALDPALLGNWPDSFVQPTTPRGDQARAIDHVSPRVGGDDEGLISRRFQHRTLLEHFVAQYLSGLDVAHAAELLAPHLSFDPDWEVAAPAAIAAHPQRDLLLTKLLPSTAPAATNAAQVAADAELDRLLMRIAAESAPSDWDSEWRSIIDDTRLRRATEEPALLAASAQWEGSNEAALYAVLAGLSTADPNKKAALATAVVALSHTEEQADEAFRVLLNVSTPYDRFAAIAAAPKKGRKRRRVLMRALTEGDERASLNLAPAVIALVRTDNQRAEAFSVLKSAVQIAPPFAVGNLAQALQALATSVEMRREAWTALLSERPRPNQSAASNAAQIAVALATTPEEDEEVTLRCCLRFQLPRREPPLVWQKSLPSAS